MDAGRLEREREFHDELAATMNPSTIPIRPLEGLDAYLVAAAGGVTGRRVLDLGCGDGSLTVGMLLDRPSAIAALDLSPGMVDVTRQRVERGFPDAPATFAAAPAESMPFDDASFDVVVGRFILHHLDLDGAAREIARVLAPGGVAVFIENSGRNPILRFARDHIAGRLGVQRVGTVDEHPLRDADLAVIKKSLPASRFEYPVFSFFTILDRQVFRYRFKPVSWLCARLDVLVWRLVPPVRQYSFRAIVRASR